MYKIPYDTVEGEKTIDDKFKSEVLPKFQASVDKLIANLGCTIVSFQNTGLHGRFYIDLTCAINNNGLEKVMKETSNTFDSEDWLTMDVVKKKNKTLICYTF